MDRLINEGNERRRRIPRRGEVEVTMPWYMRCPSCGTYIAKDRADDPWECECGWRGERND